MIASRQEWVDTVTGRASWCLVIAATAALGAAQRSDKELWRDADWEIE